MNSLLRSVSCKVVPVSLAAQRRCRCTAVSVQQRQQAQSRSLSTAVCAASREHISTTDAPAAVGPYSQAVRVGKTVYLSGQIGLVPGTKELASGGVEGELEQVMKNLGAVLRAAGCDYKDVVRTTILMADMADYAAVNSIYGSYFKVDPPARACFAVKTLPLNARVEIEAMALVP